MGLSLWDSVGLAAMVVVECIIVGQTTVSKAAMSRGMSPLIFTFYSYGFATLILLPSSFLFHRRTRRPPLSFPLLCRFFLFSLIGYVGRTLLYVGIRYSSPTLASAMNNLIPAFTFIFAIIFRMEKLDVRSLSSQAQSIGTFVSIAGAFVVTLYKGPPIIMTPSPFNSPDQFLSSPQSNWVIGELLTAAYSLLFSTWYILQVSIMKEYPAELSVVFLYCFFATIISAVVTLIAERDASSWRLRPDIELIAILSSAVGAAVLYAGVHTWVIKKKGPLYVAMFKPLGIVIAILLGVSCLGVKLLSQHKIGATCVVGSIIISLGFYGVMWGKVKEEKMGEDNGVYSLDSSTQKDPLLPSN